MALNLSFYEVQEAADIVASASDQEVNMIFGSVINDNLKDEIIVTVIATGFNEGNSQVKPASPSFGQQKPSYSQQPINPVKREQKREEVPAQEQSRVNTSAEDTLDIPTFLRNRNRRR